MDFRKLSDASLVDFAQNITVKAFTDPASYGLQASQVSALDGGDDLDNAIQNALQARTDSLEKTELKNTSRQSLIDTLAQIKTQMRASDATADKFLDLGFDAYDLIASPIIPVAPTDLTATGDSTRQNYLKWQGNNKSGTVTYIIEVRSGDEGVWTFVDAVKAQRFTHQNVIPGQYYEYRVKAKSAKFVSAHSNTAVVYGMS